MKLAEAEQRAQVASAALQQTKSSSAEAMQHAQAEKDRAVMQAQQLQESRMKAERDVETHRRVAMDLEVALRKEKEEVQRLKTAPPIAKPGPSAQEVKSARVALCWHSGGWRWKWSYLLGVEAVLA